MSSNAKATHIFSAKISMYLAYFKMQMLPTFFQQKSINIFAIFLDRNFSVTLADNFIKFWTTGPKFISFFTTETCWYVSYYTMKTYIVGTHQMCLIEVLLMSTHDIMFLPKVFGQTAWANVGPYQMLQNLVAEQSCLSLKQQFLATWFWRKMCFFYLQIFRARMRK